LLFILQLIAQGCLYDALLTAAGRNVSRWGIPNLQQIVTRLVVVMRVAARTIVNRLLQVLFEEFEAATFFALSKNNLLSLHYPKIMCKDRESV